MTNGDTHHWQIAAAVCTHKELQALELRDRHGYGTRMIALTLGVTRATVRERLANADRKIAHAISDNPEAA